MAKTNIIGWLIFITILNSSIMLTSAMAGVGSGDNINVWSDWGATLKADTLRNLDNDESAITQTSNQISNQQDFIEENENPSSLDFLDDLFKLRHILNYVADLFGIIFLSVSGLALIMATTQANNIFLTAITLPLFGFGTYLILRLAFTEGRTG